MPAEPATVGTYLADRAGTRSTATLARRLAAISTAHRLAGHHLDTRHPAIRSVMQGIRRTHSTAPRKANPLRTSALRSLLDTCGTTRLIDRRDRALLLLGLASALRRAELAALTMADLGFVDAGMDVVRRARQDRPGSRRPGRRRGRHRQSDLPRSGAADLAGGRRHHRWRGVPRDRSS
jgi:integrase